MPHFTAPHGFICWPINWLMALRKLSCHSSLWPSWCEGLVQSHSPSPGAPFCPLGSSLQLLTETPAQNAFLMDCRLKTIWVWAWMDRGHLDQVCFLYWPILCTHKMWSVPRSCSCLHNNSFLCILKPMKIHVKQKSGLDICKHPKLLSEDKDCGKASHTTTQMQLEIRGKPHFHVAK